MATLILAEQHQGQLKAGTANVVMAARELAQPIELLLIGPGAAAAAEQAAALVGVDRVLVVETAAPCAPESQAELIAGLAGRQPGQLLAEASVQGRSVLPRVAALLDVGMIAEVIGIDSPTVFRRPIYAGNAIARIESLDEVQVLTIRASAFAPAEQGEPPCPIVRLEQALLPTASRVVSEVLSTSARPELGSARVVVSGGRGLGSRENFALVERVADRLGGAVGASRSVAQGHERHFREKRGQSPGGTIGPTLTSSDVARSSCARAAPAHRFGVRFHSGQPACLPDGASVFG